MMKASIALLSVGVAFSVYRSFVLQPNTETHPSLPSSEGATTTEDGEAYRQLEAEVQAMKSQLFLLRARTANEASAVGDDDPAESEVATSKSRSEQIADDKRHREELLAEVEANFQLETRNSQFASTMTPTVWHTIDEDPVFSKAVRDVDCRANTCRVEIVDSGDAEFQKRFPELALAFVETLPNITANRMQDGDGPYMVLYMSGERRPDGAALN